LIKSLPPLPPTAHTADGGGGLSGLIIKMGDNLFKPLLVVVC
jgi:hypothetical protein